MLKLGTPNVTETTTGLKGMLTHMQINPGNQRYYFFQPEGIDPQDGHPVLGWWGVESFLSGAVEIQETDIPIELLGSKARDKASGMEGTIIALVIHINGCIHADIQPVGRLAKNNSRIKAHNFDIRRLEGENIKPLAEQELETSKKTKPSPEPVESYSPVQP